ncbi:hypothetical protein LTR56_012388 [Elasticomyces elasticus]|uniref:Apple domain-containing protein n=1 Tax=Elasticomyces elasticus TaxID=574655 RepID=A0AAN7W6W0_9PEZI|nr:hypothetical protein LTR56_012388 [Elasticomyces elasticus]KAK3652348.1 hypothetical protein LTR22_011702 [Elasticomyces elasticus]KAK4919006.1 hypothetical protein LTR49_013323 [Elasticomyces elasticus]KAK4951180.1 hypothetical protein LTR10_010152 [Elasticomyces elasticus]KAK4972057.1 hypothetical protein LTR42_006562 [Elasticomyces elasticus]
MSSMDAPQREPQRLSALYQYHNAPEVAPAHGLEYDDTVYPSSDKYPVIREAPSYDPSNYKGKHSFPSDNRPPRIIFGMKVRTFLVVALVIVLITVGAAVGGAVGGKSMRENQPLPVSTVSSNSSTAEAPATRATFAPATPTFTPLADCANGTSYTSRSSKDVQFNIYCNTASPLSQNGASKMAEAFTYSFGDCIEVCAGLNGLNGGSNCTVAAYEATASRPFNCWLGYANDVVVGSLKGDEGTDFALVDYSS